VTEEVQKLDIKEDESSQKKPEPPPLGRRPSDLENEIREFASRRSLSRCCNPVK